MNSGNYLKPTSYRGRHPGECYWYDSRVTVTSRAATPWWFASAASEPKVAVTFTSSWAHRMLIGREPLSSGDELHFYMLLQSLFHHWMYMLCIYIYSSGQSLMFAQPTRMLQHKATGPQISREFLVASHCSLGVPNFDPFKVLPPSSCWFNFTHLAMDTS